MASNLALQGSPGSSTSNGISPFRPDVPPGVPPDAHLNALPDAATVARQIVAARIASDPSDALVQAAIRYAGDRGNSDRLFRLAEEVVGATPTPEDIAAAPSICSTLVFPRPARTTLEDFMKFASRQMRALAELVDRVGPVDITVLIQGETGTGKELVARALHAVSPRARKPFVAFNCAAVPGELADSQLFGHAKGAFTGALTERKGAFRTAEGGVLFLDEVGELSGQLQAKLLRVLQEREIQVLGQDRMTPVDVRIIAATNRNLEAEVAKGNFREDLFYRLKAVPFTVPPLRERREDIPELARHFITTAVTKFGRPLVAPSADLLERVSANPWPGNVRELENAMESLVAQSRNGHLDLAFLAPGAPLAAGTGPTVDTASGNLRTRTDAYARNLIISALEAAGGNLRKAAVALGDNPKTVRNQMTRLGIPLGTGRSSG